MGRRQVRLGEKERFVLECELKENVKDFVTAIQEDLLKQSVYSNEDITLQEDVHGAWERERLRLDMADLYIIHCSGYACTYATDVEKIKAAIMMKCDEKAKDTKYIEPHVTKQL